MAKVSKKKTVEKKITKKVDNNKVSIFPTLGIILALLTSSIFHYYDNKAVLTSLVLNKEELSVALDAISIVTFNFITYNSVLLFLELFLYWKKKYKALYVVVGALIVMTILSGALNYLYTTLVPLLVGIYYIIVSLKKES